MRRPRRFDYLTSKPLRFVAGIKNHNDHANKTPMETSRIKSPAWSEAEREIIAEIKAARRATNLPAVCCRRLPHRSDAIFTAMAILIRNDLVKTKAAYSVPALRRIAKDQKPRDWTDGLWLASKLTGEPSEDLLAECLRVSRRQAKRILGKSRN